MVAECAQKVPAGPRSVADWDSRFLAAGAGTLGRNRPSACAVPDDARVAL